MATEIRIPKLGMVMEEATVVRWLVDDGASVAKDEPVVEIESEKITYQVPAPAAGVVHHAVAEGFVGPVGGLLGAITAEGEGVTIAATASPPPREAATMTSAPSVQATAAVAMRAAGGPNVASPAARRLAREQDVDLAQVVGSGPQGRIVEGDVLSYLEAHKAPRISPVARKVAEGAGVDVTHVHGSGSHGRILRDDVERVIHEAERALPTEAPKTAAFTGMRRTIARHMLDSLQTMAQVTLFTECDVTELVRLRERLRHDFDLTYTDLLILAAARALERHPGLNVSLAGDEIVQHTGVHIGVAVALDDGLIVPVIRDANRKTLREIAGETKDLAERARGGRLGMDDASGSTFSVTNLGRYGIDGFTPIINPPEVAILGVGRIVEKPAAYRGAVALRQRLTLSLTHDHRVVDGAPAAAFLQTVAESLEMPYFLARC